jgi:hypothetical protein
MYVLKRSGSSAGERNCAEIRTQSVELVLNELIGLILYAVTDIQKDTAQSVRKQTPRDIIRRDE